jgi:CRISPR-associated protein Cas1
MNIVTIDKKDITLKVSAKILTIDSQKVPLKLIDILIIANKNMITTSDINKLTKEGIGIILLSHNLYESSIIYAFNPKNAELKLAQYNAVVNKSVLIAKYILLLKIKSHLSHLAKHQIIINFQEFEEKVKKSISLEELLGIEGSFSKLYFSYYFKLFSKTLTKGKRSKRPPLDPLNALMSWFYTLTYNILAIKLLSFGFEPALGFLHKPFRSHLALSSDLLEIFRADINQKVYEIFNSKLLTIQDFTKKDGVYLKYEAKKIAYKEFKNFINELSPKIDYHIANLRSQF